MLLGSELFLVVGLSDSVGSVEKDGRNDTDGTPEGTVDGAALGWFELLGMVLGAELFLVVGSVDPRVVGALDREGGAETRAVGADDGTAEGEKTISAEGAIVGGPVRTGGAVDVGATVGGTLGLAVVGLHEMCGAVVVGAAVVGLHEICGGVVVLGAVVGVPVGKQETCVFVNGLSSCVRPLSRLALFVVVS